MKIIALGMVAFLLSFNSQAQNKNVKTEVKTKITTIKDSQGEKKLVKTEEVKEVQAVELMDADSKVLNKDTKETPVEVTATTKITADGVTKLIDVDRSAYYELDGVKYQVSNDKSGYTVFSPDGKKSAILRKTSNNNYIYKSKNKTSFGYFDGDGNLVLESYDEATDTITVTTYVIEK
ncbi:hypothetical protein [Flavobacterium sp. WC2430]|uniref:hypothetical protein n=1 Tax=Flavobacterium sp. WC2430 TaxID=3234137 RepID=UPI00346539DF